MAVVLEEYGSSSSEDDVKPKTLELGEGPDLHSPATGQSVRPVDDLLTGRRDLKRTKGIKDLAGLPLDDLNHVSAAVVSGVQE